MECGTHVLMKSADLQTLICTKCGQIVPRNYPPMTKSPIPNPPPTQS